MAAFQRAALACLVATMVGSLVSFTVIRNPHFIWTFLEVHAAILLAYVWIIYVLLFISDHRRTTGSYEQEPVTVLLTHFNEEPQLLERSVRSVLRANGNVELVIVDDGSTRPDSRGMLRKLADLHRVRMIWIEHNRGKRSALAQGIQMVETPYVITIDSDTVVEETAIVNLVTALKREKVGAVSGDVRVLNEQVNWVTKMSAAYYWCAMNIYRKAHSSIGMVACCSGALAGFRTEVLRSVVPELMQQSFLGKPSTHTEDRHITNLILKRGWNVSYAHDAVGHTYAPQSLKGFFLQQQRWQRGFLQESIYVLWFALRKRPALFFEVLVWDLLQPALFFGLMVNVFVTLFLHPVVFWEFILPGWVGLMAIRNLPLLLTSPKRIPALGLYAVVISFVLYWQAVYSLFTAGNRSWMTRRAVASAA